MTTFLRPEDAPSPSPPPPHQQQQVEEGWEFCDLGFDTVKRLWFVQLTDRRNRPAGFIYARTIRLDGGCAKQYEWKDPGGAPAWHVRERFFNVDVRDLVPEGWDPQGGCFASLTVKFEARIRDSRATPDDYDYLCYGYFLRSSRGFVEFFKGGKKIAFLPDRWVLVENVPRETYGEIPDLRLKVLHEDVLEIILTDTAVVIRGRPSSLI